MNTPLDQLPVIDVDSGLLHVVIETPKGSRIKYKYDPQTGQMRVAKVLPAGLAFPLNFGFIPSTQGEDGDPLDILLFMDEAVFPGCVVTARLIGVLEAEQKEKGAAVRNDRLVAALQTHHNPAVYSSIREILTAELDEIDQFFVTYNEAEGRKFRPLGKQGPKRAKQLLLEGMIDSSSKVQKALK